MFRTLCATFGLALALLIAAPAAHADQWSKTFSVTGTPQLTLQVDNGQVSVNRGVSNQVFVSVTTTGWKIPADIRVIPSQQGNDVEVQVKQTQHWFTFSHGTTHVTVTLPATANLDLSTGNGDVTLGDLSGSLRATTGNGTIHATNLGGHLAFHTGNGGIDASGLDGSLRARTGNGAVRVSGRFDALELDSGRGHVHVTALAGSKMASDWSIGTGVGGVTVSLPANISADLSASTGVGHIATKFPVTVSGSIAGSSVRGRLGAGGPLLRIHTGVGDVSIERGE
jgi:DUF4097 and DUF4098 domain-containing protein YvlB